jgi:hypothetical protein
MASENAEGFAIGDHAKPPRLCSAAFLIAAAFVISSATAFECEWEE